MVSIANSQKLLGNVDITPYIGTIPIIAESKQTELESLVLQQRKATEGRIYDIEKNLLVTLDTHIKQELIRSCYAPISLEFLRTSQEKDYEGKMFPVPRFGVFPIDNKTAKVSICEFLRGRTPFQHFLLTHFSSGIFSYYIGFSSEGLYDSIPLLFHKELVHSLGLVDKQTTIDFISSEIPQSSFEDRAFCWVDNPCKQYSSQKSRGKLWRLVGGRTANVYCDPDKVFLTTELNVIIPPETKEKIVHAKKLFGKKNMYFIADVDAKDWAFGSPKSELHFDPLIVGTDSEQAYFIDSFNTTLYEEITKIRNKGNNPQMN